MTDGDFILLGPAAYIPQEMTLNSLLFTKPDSTSTIQFYILVCTKV